MACRRIDDVEAAARPFAAGAAGDIVGIVAAEAEELIGSATTGKDVGGIVAVDSVVLHAAGGVLDHHVVGDGSLRFDAVDGGVAMPAEAALAQIDGDGEVQAGGGDGV